ncbi:GGDEF domain-containing protein [Candidatus Burkholderia verschuerenii]|uniref:GGDEF domain-containing protein n=1 Tax=Candidatus Burkholderia verschuerenii TaxID=242163 RepID=UPI0026D726A6
MFSPVSILVVTALSSILSIFALISLRPHVIEGVSHWIWANVIAIVSLVLFSMQGVVPAWLGIVAANQLIAATSLRVFEGCNAFFGVQVGATQRAIGWGMWLLVLAGIVYYTYVDPDMNARVVIVSAFHAAFDLAMAGRVLSSRPPERPRYNYMFVVVGATLGGIGYIVRGSIYLIVPPAQTALLQPGAMQIVFLALGILVLPTLSIGLVMMAHDRLSQRLERLARFDDLTGALSRKAFIELATNRLARAKEFVAVVDIDHFKSVNDRFGHAAGDDVLRHFAGIVAARIGARGVRAYRRRGVLPVLRRGRYRQGRRAGRTSARNRRDDAVRRAALHLQRGHRAMGRPGIARVDDGARRRPVVRGQSRGPQSRDVAGGRRAGLSVTLRRRSRRFRRVARPTGFPSAAAAASPRRARSSAAE